MRVQRVQKVQRVQRVQRGRLTGLRPEGCGRLSAAGYVRFAQGATALRAEGCGIAPWAMSIKSALRDWLSMSYSMKSILLIGSLRSPPLSGFAIGHACGVRVDGASPRRLWPPAGGRLCSLALRGQRPFGPRVADCRSAAMLIKSALRDLLSVSYDMISILVISRYAAPPYPATPDFPPSGGQNKSLYAFRRQR